jgi:hypothetical protein
MKHYSAKPSIGVSVLSSIIIMSNTSRDKNHLCGGDALQKSYCDCREPAKPDKPPVPMMLTIYGSECSYASFQLHACISSLPVGHLPVQVVTNRLYSTVHMTITTYVHTV